MGYRVRNFSVIFLILLASLLIQYTLFLKIPYVTSSPDLMLIVTFIFGFVGGKNTGMITGFFAGLMIDVFYCPVIGYNALILMCIGFICGYLNRLYYAYNLFVPLMIMILCDLGNNLLYFLVWHVLQAQFDFGYTFIHVMLPEMCLTFVAGMVLYTPLTMLAKKMYAYLDTDEQDI